MEGRGLPPACSLLARRIGTWPCGVVEKTRTTFTSTCAFSLPPSFLVFAVEVKHLAGSKVLAFL